MIHSYDAQQQRSQSNPMDSMLESSNGPLQQAKAPAFQLSAGPAIQARLVHRLIRDNQPYRTKAYQLSEFFDDYFYQQADAHLNGFRPTFGTMLDILGEAFEAHDQATGGDKDPTQAPHLGAIQQRIQNKLNDLGRGRSHLTHDLNGNDQNALQDLTDLSVEVRDKHNNAQETQSMRLGTHELSAINHNGGPQYDGSGTGLSNGRTLVHGNNRPRQLGNNLHTQQANHVPVTHNDLGDAHAEIMLLKSLIYHIMQVNELPDDTIYIAGRRVPCIYCQKILTRFEVVNAGRVKVKYDTQHASQERANTQQDQNLVKPNQAQNVQNYHNSLSDQHLTQAIANYRQQHAPAPSREVLRWLDDVTPLLNYDPTA